jgi:arsenate reductase-like glutaredoxin family protein
MQVTTPSSTRWWHPPFLINRPLVETEKGVRLCRPQDVVHEIL